MSKLYLIPTPIGNLEDISFRAVRLLKEVDLILAEDTRKARILLNHYNVQTPVIAYHMHNEHGMTNQLVKRMKAGEVMGLISDAGTPAISDPGYLLLRECLREKVNIETLPGASAFLVALVNSGIPCDRFVFEGFLPKKKGRQTRWLALAEEQRTFIFYESPHRLEKTLKEMIEYLGANRQIAVCRELTKLHEENVRGSIEDVLTHFQQKKVKGEIVIVVEGLKK